MSLTLENKGIAVSHNYPYYLPDGSVEIRSQVWMYFRYLREAFEDKFGDSREDPVYQVVWNMLLDTNLRNSESEALRSYLHMFRKASRGNKGLFRRAQKAYEHVTHFFEEHMESLIMDFRRSPDRTSALAIEVRKDLVWQFHDHHNWDPVLGPEGAQLDNIKHITSLMAQSIDTYFASDRETFFVPI
jgi:hypothetical protein